MSTFDDVDMRTHGPGPAILLSNRWFIGLDQTGIFITSYILALAVAHMQATALQTDWPSCFCPLWLA
jgi:hypothetical protein